MSCNGPAIVNYIDESPFSKYEINYKTISIPLSLHILAKNKTLNYESETVGASKQKSPIS